MKILAELTKEYFIPTPKQKIIAKKLVDKFHTIPDDLCKLAISITAITSMDKWGFVSLSFTACNETFTDDQLIKYFTSIIKSVTKEKGILATKTKIDGEYQEIQIMFLFGGNYKSRFKEVSTKAYGAFVPAKQKEI